MCDACGSAPSVASGSGRAGMSHGSTAIAAPRSPGKCDWLNRCGRRHRRSIMSATPQRNGLTRPSSNRRRDHPNRHANRHAIPTTGRPIRRRSAKRPPANRPAHRMRRRSAGARGGVSPAECFASKLNLQRLLFIQQPAANQDRIGNKFQFGPPHKDLQAGFSIVAAKNRRAAG